MNLPRVSVIIPILNEAAFIGKLINALERQTYDKSALEVLILDGGSTDGTLDIIAPEKLPPYITVIHNPHKFHVYALNIGLSRSTGEIIIRMDGHSLYEDAYIEKCVKWLVANPDVLCIGGVTRAEGYDFGSSVIARLVNSPFGVGGASFRYAKAVTQVYSVFPGAWRKSDLVASGGWDETQLTAQDIELSRRMSGILQGKYLVDPDIKLSYYPRNSIKKLARQYFRSGWWRIFTTKKYPDMLSPLHLVPPALVAGSALGIILAVISAFTSPGLIPVFLLPIILYAVYAAVVSLLLMRGEKPSFKSTAMLFTALFAMHYSWGAGFIVSCFQNKYFPMLKRKPR